MKSAGRPDLISRVIHSLVVNNLCNKGLRPRSEEGGCGSSLPWRWGRGNWKHKLLVFIAQPAGAHAARAWQEPVAVPPPAWAWLSVAADCGDSRGPLIFPPQLPLTAAPWSLSLGESLQLVPRTALKWWSYGV